MSEPGRGGGGDDIDCLVSNRSLSLSVAEVTFTTQHQAAAALIDHTNEDNLTWLKLIRSAPSIEPIQEQCSWSAHLSPKHIHALLALKDCPNDQLVASLGLARCLRIDPTTTAFAHGPSIDTPPSSAFRSRGRQFAAAYPLSYLVDSTSSRYTENHYWCTVCEHPNSYKDKGNWKKHEKGHETVFICGLDNVIGDGPAGQSSSTPLQPLSCKRRDVMVSHLNKWHGISAVQQGRDLADKWRTSIKKQAWSCGFCVNVFLNFRDRLKHIDTAHFKNYENIQCWDVNKVIQGLLRQPGMETAWKKRTESLLPWMQPEDLIWTEAFAKEMRTKLEIGPSDASDAHRLADEVYTAGRPKECLNESAMVSSTVFPTSIVGASSMSSSNEQQMITISASESAPMHCQRPSTIRRTSPLYGDSLFGQSPVHAYSHDRAVPASASSAEDSRVTYNVRSFYPSQDWIGASEGGTGCSGFDQSVIEADRCFCPSSSGWKGQ